MLPDNIDKTLRSIYFNPNSEAGFSSIDKLYDAARLKDPHVTRSDVRDWLASEMTYSLHNPTRNTFARNRCIVGHVDEQWQADLVDMARFSLDNDDYTFILTVIDMFSKYAWTVPVMSKSGPLMKAAFRKIFSEGRLPLKLQTDKGLEFRNRILQDFLKQEHVYFFTTKNSDIKCAVVERFNRTLKTRIFKYLTAKVTKRYIDILPALTASYNRSRHRTTKMRPIDVTPHDMNEERYVFYNTYKAHDMHELQRQNEKRIDQFDVGDEVRIALLKKTFSKGYKQQWSVETYKVVNCIHRPDKTVYEIANANHKLLKKKFYPEELSKVTQNLSKITRVIRTRVKNKLKQYLVEINDHQGERNRWIPENDLPPAFRKV